MVKIELEKINKQKRIMVEALLDSRAIGLVMSLKFVRKQGFKLKKIKRPIYIRNVDGTFNKKELIEYIVEVNNRNKCDWRTEVEYNFGNAMACPLQF